MPRETLNRGHTLRGKKLIPLIRMIRWSTANPTDLARIDPSRPTEDLSLKEMEDIFSTLTGETMEDILEMAGRDVTMHNGQLLIHHTVMFANEVGQPSEQDPVDTPITPQVHEAVLTPKQVSSQPCSSSSSRPVAAPAASSSSSLSAPTPDPSTATRSVAAPAASSSTSSSALTPDPSAATRPVAAPASSSTSSSAPTPDPSAATRPVTAPAASSSTSRSAPIPDPSAATRPVAAPAASSSTSSSAPTTDPSTTTRPVAAPASSSTSSSAPTSDPSAATRPVTAPAASSSTSRSAPIPDPSAATRPVAAPAASSSTSSSAPTPDPSAATRPVTAPAASSSTSSSALTPDPSAATRPVAAPAASSSTSSSAPTPDPSTTTRPVATPAASSSTSSSAPTPDPSAATRPVAAPAASSSTSRSTPTPNPSAATRPVAASSSTSSPAEVLGEPLILKASDINPEVSKALLHNNRMVLVTNADFRYIKDRLLQDGILTVAEMETVESRPTRGEQMSKLVDILVLKPDNHVVRFFESLEKADGALYSQLDMSPEKTRRDNCSTSGKADHLSIIKEELKDWYKQSMAKIKPMPWCEWFEQDLDHVYTNVRVVEGKKHQISHRLPGVTQSTDERDASSLLERVFSPTDGRTICFVQGAAGAGKSIFCRRSVYLWSKGEGLDFDLVFLLTANLLKGVLKTDIREQLFPDDFILPEDDVYSCLQENQTNVLLIIDGLDEININSKGMECVMQLIQGKILRKVNMLLTGRPEVSKTIVGYARVHLEICGFTYANVVTYVLKYFSNDRNRGWRLLQLLKSHARLADVARTPFTTLLLCTLAETDGDVPDKIDKIYHQVISLVFRKYVRKLTDGAQGSAHSTSTEEVSGAAETSEAAEITETQLLQGAASLAYKFQFQKEQNCQEKELLAICNKADHLLKSGILNRDYNLSRMHDASAYCYFPHRSIQEYLCAWYLSTNTDELAKKINVNLIVFRDMIRGFYISIFFREAQTALTNVDVAWGAAYNLYPLHDATRRLFEFFLAEALWERIPNKATKEFLVERMFGTFERALCCLVHIQERGSYDEHLTATGYLTLMGKLLTDGPLTQRSQKYDHNVSLPDVPVVFRFQHCVHYSYIHGPSDAGYYHGHRLSYGTAITLLPNNVGRQKIDDLRDLPCKANILIVLVFEDLHNDSSQNDILFVLDRLWDWYRYGYRYNRRTYRLRTDRDERPHLIRLRPTIRVEAAVHPETKLSRTVSVDCRLRRPFYKMYYERFCPY